MLFEPVKLGPVTMQEPLLPGAALQRHGATAAARARGDARRESRGRLGGGVHRDLLDPSELRRSTPFLAGAALGRSTMPALRLHDRCDPRARRAGRRRARARRLAVANPLHARAPAGARSTSRSRRDPIQAQAHGQGRHQALPALASRAPRCAREAAGFDIIYVYAGRRPRVSAVFPVAPPQPPHRRVRRLAREPHAPAARADRGHQGRGRRYAARSSCASRSTSCSGAEADRRRRRRATSSPCWPNCPTCGT